MSIQVTEGTVGHVLKYVDRSINPHLPIDPENTPRYQEEIITLMPDLLTKFPTLKQFNSLPFRASSSKQIWMGKREVNHLYRLFSWNDYALARFAMHVLDSILNDNLSKKARKVLFQECADTEIAWTIGPFLLDEKKWSEVTKWLETGKPDQDPRNIYLNGVMNSGVHKPFILPYRPYDRNMNIASHPNYIAAQTIAHYMMQKKLI